MEYEGLNVNCLSSGIAEMSNTLLITHLRNPVSRLNSEFWYKGPGSKVLSGNESTWMNWIAESKPLPNGDIPRFRDSHGNVYKNFNAGIYWPNYYVRILTAQCGEPCHASRSKRNSHHLDGCPAHSSSHPVSTIGRCQLELAKDVLRRRFDLVLITEDFGRTDVQAWLKHTLTEAIFPLPSSRKGVSFDPRELRESVRKTSVGKDDQGMDEVPFR
jgi:hypothetical protein